MKVSDIGLPGLKLVELDRFGDERGYFCEWIQTEKLASSGLEIAILQMNMSSSAPGVIRGLHYQPSPPQGKLIGVISGAIWDVAVDIRAASPTFGQHFSIALSDDIPALFWIPPGFAHGFCVSGSHPAKVMYAVDQFWNPKSESGLRWNDPDLGIEWPVDSPCLSSKDRDLPLFRDYQKSPAFD
jgi:dTDP-4-dehydrorhamnose 3,5-epimerase